MSSGNIGGSFSGQNYNRDIYIPLDDAALADRRSGGHRCAPAASRPKRCSSARSRPRSTISTTSTKRPTSSRRCWKSSTSNIDYEVIVPKELLRQAEVLQMMFNVLLVLIASIALLVGGIGIMNIMLATVTERTREIGIRRALGAKQRDIVQQFLSETVVLSATGGLLGVLLGILLRAGGRAACALDRHARLSPTCSLRCRRNIQQLEPRLAAWSVAAAFLISVAVGVVFGMYPARRAAQMDPIEALRHE